MEKYITFSIRDLKFVDSYNFLSSSLDTLTSALSSFTFVEYTQLRRKGVYPYEFMDRVEKLNLTTLTLKEAFFSKFVKENVSDKDYEHVQTVWREFNIQNMREYHNLY